MIIKSTIWIKNIYQYVPIYKENAYVFETGLWVVSIKDKFNSVTFFTGPVSYLYSYKKYSNRVGAYQFFRWEIVS